MGSNNNMKQAAPQLAEGRINSGQGGMNRGQSAMGRVAQNQSNIFNKQRQMGMNNQMNQGGIGPSMSNSGIMRGENNFNQQAPIMQNTADNYARGGNTQPVSGMGGWIPGKPDFIGSGSNQATDQGPGGWNGGNPGGTDNKAYIPVPFGFRNDAERNDWKQRNDQARQQAQGVSMFDRVDPRMSRGMPLNQNTMGDSFGNRIPMNDFPQVQNPGTMTNQGGGGNDPRWTNGTWGGTQQTPMPPVPSGNQDNADMNNSGLSQGPVPQPSNPQFNQAMNQMQNNPVYGGMFRRPQMQQRMQSIFANMRPQQQMQQQQPMMDSSMQNFGLSNPDMNP